MHQFHLSPPNVHQDITLVLGEIRICPSNLGQAQVCARRRASGRWKQRMTMVVMLRGMMSVATTVTTSLVFIPYLHVAGSVTVQGRSCHRV